MIYCSECGKDNRDEARFCRNCGTPIDLITSPQIPLPVDQDSPSAGELLTGVAERSQTEVNQSIVMADPPALSSDQLAGIDNPSLLSHEQLIMNSEDLAAPLAVDRSLLAVESEPASEPNKTAPPPLPAEAVEESPVVDNQTPADQPLEQTQVDAQPDPSIAGADLPILGPGAILHGRYHIQILLSRLEPGNTEGVVYAVEDWLRCWSCQSVQSDPDPHFCEICGAELTQKPLVHLRVIPIPPAILPGDCFTEQGITYQVVVPPTPVENRPLRLQMFVGYQSDTGKQRDLDEDSLVVLQLTGLAEMRNAPMLGFFAVADGIGGYAAGEVASRTALQMLAGHVMEKIYLPIVRGKSVSLVELETILKEIILEANQAILTLHKTGILTPGAEHDTARDLATGFNPGSDMGCTLTAALVYDTSALIANVGDSRTYLVRNGTLTRLTVDHSVVAKMVEQGLITNEQAYVHDQRNVIYRSLGDKTELDVDIFPITLEPGDRLVLCCDGLWEMVHDPYMEDVLIERYDPQSACDRLVELANLAGGEDNISVIVVNILPLGYPR